MVLLLGPTVVQVRIQGGVRIINPPLTMGEIMNMGVYFGGGYEKNSVVFPSLSTSSKEKIDLYLEFHFVVNKKL